METATGTVVDRPDWRMIPIAAYRSTVENGPIDPMTLPQTETARDDDLPENAIEVHGLTKVYRGGRGFEPTTALSAVAHG